MQAIVITWEPDHADPRHVVALLNKPDDLEPFAWFTQLCGGPIEGIEMGPEMDGWGHGDGKYVAPPNRLGTYVWHRALAGTGYFTMPGDFIAGPLVITGPTAPSGESTTIPEAIVDRIMQTALAAGAEIRMPTTGIEVSP